MQHKTQHATGPIHAEMTIPGAKSITQRALLMAAIADGVSEISGMHLGDDTQTFIAALQQTGIVAQLDEQAQSCIIAGCNGKLPKAQASIWCGDSISTVRYLLTACAASPGIFYFDGSSNLKKLFLADLLTILNRRGVQLIPSDAHQLPFTLIGMESLEGGEVLLDNPIDHQIISALFIVSPYSRSQLTFTVPDPENQKCIDLTCLMMAEFGVLVHRIHDGQYIIPVPQRYQARDYLIEPDFSLAAYFFAAAAVTGGEITIQPTKRSSSKQSDIKFLSWLEKMGCRVIENNVGLSLSAPPQLNGIEVSMRTFTSPFSILLAIAPFATSPTRITHIGKPSTDDVELMQALKIELLKMQIDVETGEDWIKIHPGTPKACVVDSHQDYRIGMALFVIGLKVPGLEIINSNCITDKYPDFFLQWAKLLDDVGVAS